jgi:hypothetical protein
MIDLTDQITIVRLSGHRAAAGQTQPILHQVVAATAEVDQPQLQRLSQPIVDVNKTALVQVKGLALQRVV